MKKKLLLLITALLIITLSGCIGNYREGYAQYNRPVSTYNLYYQDLDDEEECPMEDGHLYTLYASEGNTFKYEGIRTGDGCRVELVADTGAGFTSVANLLKNEKISVADLEAVNWTFDFVIEQTADFTIGGVSYIEYFEEIGDYEVYVVDYDDTICHDNNTVFLFEYRDEEYNVVGAPSGDGCYSEYFVYVVEEAEEPAEGEEAVEPDGELMTVDAALQADHITVAEINAAELESEIIRMYIQGTILATEATLYFDDVTHTYNALNPYTLTETERGIVVGILATNKYRYALHEDSEKTPYIILNDTNYEEHKFLLFDLPQSLEDDNEFPTETVVAVLTLTDMTGTEYIFEIYETGIRIVDDEINVYTEHINQTFILDLLDDLTE